MSSLIRSTRSPQTLVLPCSPHRGEVVAAVAEGALGGAALPEAALEEGAAEAGRWFSQNLEVVQI
jgi:hypothetical protein